MMNNQDSHEPDPIRALIKAGVGNGARPNAKQHMEMLAQLKTEVQLTKVKSEFPPVVLIGISGILVFLTGWLAITNSPNIEIIRAILFIFLGLNMLSIPITCVVIIRRRHYVQKT